MIANAKASRVTQPTRLRNRRNQRRRSGFQGSWDDGCWVLVGDVCVMGYSVSQGSGTVDATGNAGYWALCKDTATSELLATGALDTAQDVTIGNTFTLAQFAFGVPDAV